MNKVWAFIIGFLVCAVWLLSFFQVIPVNDLPGYCFTRGNVSYQIMVRHVKGEIKP